MSSVRKIILGNREITIEFERKRVRNINVRVRRDGSLYCSLPYYASVKEAEAFIISKQDYLLKAIDNVTGEEKAKSLSRQYIDGETFMVFGKPMTLHVLKGSKNLCWPALWVQVKARFKTAMTMSAGKFSKRSRIILFLWFWSCMR